MECCVMWIYEEEEEGRRENGSGYFGSGHFGSAHFGSARVVGKINN